MKDIKYKKALLNAFLGESLHAKNLKDLAYARLISTILYLDNGKKVKEIKKILCSEILLVDDIPNKSLNNALNLLQDDLIIEKKKSSYYLTDETRIEFEKHEESVSGIQKEIIKKFFPTTVDYKKLVKWFLEVSVEFFSSQSEKIITQYANRKLFYIDERKKLKKTIKGITKKFKLGKFEAELEQGYFDFLSSDDPIVDNRVWHFIQGLISTQLVVSDISPNELSIERFRNSKILVDTNVLFAISLKSKSHVNKSLETLGKALQSIGIELYVTSRTEKEYENVCVNEKDNTLRVFRTYDESIINKTKGDFIKAARNTHCQTSEDIERFFSAVSKIPKSFGPLHIKKIDIEEDKYEYVKENKKDKELYDQILSAAKEQYYTKFEKAIIHDVNMTKYVQCQRGEKEAFFVLTLDTSMQNLALSWINDQEEPAWINFISLIQILAVNGGGPDFDLEKLAPIVRAFIEYGGIGKNADYDYTKRDLLYLSENVDNIAGMPTNKVKKLLGLVSRKKLQGIPDKEKRKFDLELQREAVKMRSDADEALKETHDIIEGYESREKILLTQLHIKDLREYSLKKWIVFSIKFAVAIGISLFYYYYLKDQLSEYVSMGDSKQVLDIVVFIGVPIWRVVQEFLKTVEKIREFKNKL